MAGRKLKVRFVGGALNGKRWTMREPFEPELPFPKEGLYRLHDRGAHVKQLRFEYRHVPTWTEYLGTLPAAERFARLRRAILHCPPGGIGLSDPPQEMS